VKIFYKKWKVAYSLGLFSRIKLVFVNIFQNHNNWLVEILD